MKNPFKKIKTLVILVSILYLFFTTLPAQAQEALNSAVLGPDGQPATTNQIIANMAKLTLGLVGVLALVMFIIGGITWMTSAGNAEQVKKGKGTLIWASIGLIVCFLAYSLVTFVITQFIGVAGGSNVDPDARCIQVGGSCLESCQTTCATPKACQVGLCGGGVSRQCCE
jgi:hypothetical protein